MACCLKASSHYQGQFDIPSNVFFGIHLRAILQALMNLTRSMCSEITFTKLLSCLPVGAMSKVQIWQTYRTQIWSKLCLIGQGISRNIVDWKFTYIFFKVFLAINESISLKYLICSLCVASWLRVMILTMWNSRAFSWNETVRILIKISLKFVAKGPISNIPSLVQIMAWHQPGAKPLSEPMLVRLLTHISVTWPQRVKS